MAKRKPSAEPQYAVRQVDQREIYELVPPECVEQREADMEEVRAMIEADEIDVAVDELRWLLEDCRPLLEAHKLLGEIAIADDDLPLARAHLGSAYELGLKAIPPDGLRGVLPYQRPANRVFFEAGKGLAWCLDQLGETGLAADVVRRLQLLDPTDPLDLAHLLAHGAG